MLELAILSMTTTPLRKKGLQQAFKQGRASLTHYLPSCNISKTVCDPMKPLPPAQGSRVSSGDLEALSSEGSLTSDQDQRVFILCLVELGLFQKSLRLSYRTLAIWRRSARRGREGDAPERVGIEGSDGVVGTVYVGERRSINVGRLEACWYRGWAAEMSERGASVWREGRGED